MFFKRHWCVIIKSQGDLSLSIVHPHDSSYVPPPPPFLPSLGERPPVSEFVHLALDDVNLPCWRIDGQAAWSHDRKLLMPHAADEGVHRLVASRREEKGGEGIVSSKRYIGFLGKHADMLLESVPRQP